MASTNSIIAAYTSFANGKNQIKSSTVRAISLVPQNANGTNKVTNKPINQQISNYVSVNTIISNFIPIWNTSAGPIGSVTEGQSVTISLQADNVFTRIIDTGTNALIIGGQLGPYVDTVTLNGASTSFTSGQDIIFFNAVSLTTTINVYTKRALSFQILSGFLPPGLQLDYDTGKIEGEVGNINPISQTFEFTVRISNGLHVRDRVFSIAATGIDYPVIYNNTLPDLQTIPQTTIQYAKIARLKQGESLNYKFDFFDPDGDAPNIILKKVFGLPDTGEYFSGLPAGIFLSGFELQGSVDPLNSPGFYLFKIQSPLDNVSFTFMIEVSNETAVTIQPSIRLDWITDKDLGTIYSGEPCSLNVKAQATNSEVSYEIISSLDTIPSGLDFIKSTGEFQGLNGFIDKSTTYNITIRAIAGNIFADKIFTIKLVSRLSSQNFYEVGLKLLANDKYTLLKNYENILPTDFLFRQNDTNFGLVKNPKIYILGGLDGNASIDDATNGNNTPFIGNPDYHGQLKVFLGEHKIAFVRDSKDSIIYEVLYRVIYDPQDGAGGFSSSDNVVEQKIVYPQSKDVKYIYPNSINNIRKDLTKDIGIISTDPSKRTLLGVNGAETLPVWMRSPQTIANKNSYLGYVPAIVLAYLLPGKGKEILSIIKNNIDLLVALGHQFQFDRYYTNIDLILKQTLFDGGFTTFDNVTTTLDGIKPPPFRYFGY